VDDDDDAANHDAFVFVFFDGLFEEFVISEGTGDVFYV
jgi:hypothetical protein